jgi:hypothetical protein
LHWALSKIEPPMNDGDIRRALIPRLLAEHRSDCSTLIIEELGLRHGKTRADLVVVNGLLHGYEIKSDVDSLARFSRQVDGYNSTLTRATLVVGERLLPKALTMLPAWWGVIIAFQKSCTVELHPIRGAEDNPQLNPLSLAKLLWREEALTALNQVGVTSSLLRKPKAELYRYLVAVTDFPFLQALVCGSLKSRTSWRPAVQQKLGGG